MKGWQWEDYKTEEGSCSLPLPHYSATSRSHFRDQGSSRSIHVPVQMAMSWELQHMLFRFGFKALRTDFVDVFLQLLHWYVGMLLQFQTIAVFPGNRQISCTLGKGIQANVGLQTEIMVFNFIFKILDIH